MFKEVVSGNKKFEYRKEDNGPFTQGDKLTLFEFNRDLDPPEDGHDDIRYTGWFYCTTVGFCLRGPKYGVPDGMVIFSIGG